MNTVNPENSVLLSMLSDIGVRGAPLAWFHSYLSDRKIQTRISGSLSSPLPVTSGVPQGSVLEPLLFAIYYKDIPTTTQACSALFADDTLLYRTDCLGQRCTSCRRLIDHLSVLSVWTEQE